MRCPGQNAWAMKPGGTAMNSYRPGRFASGAYLFLEYEIEF